MTDNNNNNGNNILVFSHEQDVDGLLSAAVLKMAHPNSEVVLTNYGFENMVAIREKIFSFTQQNQQQGQQSGSLGEGRIIIADIGVNEEGHNPVFEALAVSKQRGFSNMWIDHHPWPEEMKDKFSKVCKLVLYSSENEGEIRQDDGVTSKKMCATELCIEQFALDNPYAKTLGSIAHRTDFPDSARFPIPPLTGLISYYLGKKELNQKLYSVILENIVRGVLWNIEMQDDMIEASRLIDESIARSLETMTTHEFKFTPYSSDNTLLSSGRERKVRVAIVKADSFVSRSMLLGRIMDSSSSNGELKTTIDLAIAYTSDGRLSIRRNNSVPENTLQLDCGKIAATFREGGGHPSAAGGFLKTNVKRNGDDNAVIIEIESTLQNYLEQLEQQYDRQLSENNNYFSK